MEVAAGSVIGGRYRLERQIAEGGMGVVWAAEDVVDGGPRAIKLLKDRPGDRAGDPDAARRFLREARAAAAVRHPNVVRTLDALELPDGATALVMELLTGESLRDLLARRPTLTVGELAAILVPAVSAIGTAHALGIVHRDLKPENVFLARVAGEPDAIVKVLDFGIAKLTALDGEAMRSTGLTTGAVLGTPAYMAPEQVFAETDLDHRADIWALGLICYQCLTGVLPTRGDNVGQVLKNVLARPFEPLDQLVPDVPPELARLVARMTARERAERPADLREVFAALCAFTDVRAPEFAPPAQPLERADTLAGPAAPRSKSGPALPAPGAIARPGTGSRRVAWAAAAAVGVIGAALVGWRWTRAPAAVRAVGSPLAAADARLACPLLEVAGADEPAGWLGAAAAAVACERARILLGGRPERTLVPAELLDLPRRPVDGFPGDPYAAPDARARSLAAARGRASAYLDGRLQVLPPGVRVVLELRAPDGAAIARAEGLGRGVAEAVRAAMAPLIGPDRIPAAAELDPEIARWQGSREVAAALALLDVNLAMANNAGGLADECEQFESTSRRIADLGAMWRWLCARTLGRPAPELAPELALEDAAGATPDAVPGAAPTPAPRAAPSAAPEPGAISADASPAAAATRIRIRHVVDRVDRAADAEALRRQRERDPTSWGRSLLAATESCLVQSSDPDRAYDLALVAVEAEPKNPDGQPCDPWSQLMTMAQHKPIAPAAIRGMQAWQPWSSIGWFMQGLAGGDDAAALIGLRRAYALSPLDTQIAGALADRLLAAGRREDARKVARDQRAGGNPVNRLEADLLTLRIAASEAQFGKALAAARQSFAVAPDDAGWVRAQRFELAWRALELAGIVGDAPALADLVFARLIEPEPSPLDGASLAVPARIAAICALASPAVSPRCFARFAALRPRLSGAITPETDDLLRGAEAYARRDLAAAARAWRPLLRDAAPLVQVMPGAMAEVFDATGSPELADKVDLEVMLRAAEFGGASLGHARRAVRALARGDRATARAHARQVIAAWNVADETVPAVADMRRLLARLGE